MAIFDLQLMKTGYFNEEIFQEAGNLYNRMGIRFISSSIHPMTDAYSVCASVSDGEIDSIVHIEFAQAKNKDYAILVGDRKCECRDYAIDKKNCSHMAALVMFLNNYTYDEIIAGGLSSDQTSKEVFAFEETFMNDYEIAYDKKQKATIEIILELTDEENKMYFRIGQEYKKKYIVRNIYEFAKMFETNETFEYGKLFNFKHSLNNITKEDQNLVKVLIELINGKQINSKDLKTVSLTDVEVINLIELNKGRSINVIKDRLGEKVYRCVEGTMPFELKLQKEEEFYIVQTIQNCEFAWFAKTGIYSINRDTLSYFQILDNKIYEFLKTMYVKDLKVQKSDFFAFYDNVLTEVAKHVKINSEFSTSALYDGVYEFDVYIDASKSKNIIIDVQLQNDEQKCDYNFITTPEVDYSKSDALKLTKTLESYGSIRDGSIIIDDDNLIYDFCVSGIIELESFCNRIYLSEKFKNLQIRRDNKVAIGVKISNNLLNIDLQLDGIERREIMKILNSYHEKAKYHRLENGDFIDLDAEFVKDLNDIVTNLDITQEQLEQDEIDLELYRGMYLNYVDSISDSINIYRDGSYNQFMDKIKNIDDLKINIPCNLTAELKPYQVDGFKFLKTMQYLNFGAILADDMGLGKTIQVITVILSEKINKPSLIVCPSSLIFNWEKEFKKFAPSIDVITINEDGDTRAKQIKHDVANQIIVTSYELLKRDIDKYADFDFQYFVIDESHYIKNNNTKNFKAVKQIKADYKMALTGTPIENSLSELWSLFDFAIPGYLGTYASFVKKYETPIIKEDSYEKLEQLKALVRPFILRRLKSEVLDDLPEKKEEFVYVDMHDEQSKIYKANLAEMKSEIESVPDAEFSKNKLIVLSMLTKLRQLASDPRLIYNDYNDNCAKLDTAVDLIRQSMATGQKALLFSQFTSMLDLIEERLEQEGISYFVLKGSTKKNERHTLTEKFNTDDTNVFLISLKAGGTGLNLVGANTVIHFDPWWNMSAQNQATDRVHRIGQEKNVSVYKLITNQTIEEKIVDLQNKKSKLAENMLSETSDSITKMSKDELLELFK